jgi:hypothetical protein
VPKPPKSESPEELMDDEEEKKELHVLVLL